MYRESFGQTAFEGARSFKEEDERKGMARRKEESWELMRVAARFLKDNTDKWKERRIEECDRIREEDKRDRLAVAKEKKKRYGLKRLSKEENTRMTRRTEERLEIAKAKENLWKKFQERKEDDVMMRRRKSKLGCP